MSVVARVATSDAVSLVLARSRASRATRTGACHRGAWPDPVAVLDAVDVDADQADVDRDTERVGGQFEDHRSGKGECRLAVAGDGD